MAEKLQIVIEASDQASGVIRGVAGTAKGEFAGMSGVVKAHAGEIRAAGMAMTAFGAATIAVAKGNLDAFRSQEVAQAKLRAAIKGTAQQIDQSRLEKLANDLQRVTTFGDEASMEMMALLTTFNMTQDQIEQLAPRILNIAAIMGTDLQSAAVAVGKAISTNNWGALQRFGIIIDEATQKSGDFAAILQAIDRNTGPAAEELAKGAGAAEQLANQFGDLREVAGEALIPVLKTGVAVLRPTVDLMQTMVKTPVGKFFIITGTALGALMVPLGMFTMALPSLLRGWEMLSAAQIKNAWAARAAGAANAQAAAAVAAGGAAAGAGAAVGGAAAGGAMARGALVGAGARGLLGRVAGGASRYFWPAALAYGGYTLARGHLEGQIAESEAFEATLDQPADLFLQKYGAQAPGGFAGMDGIAGLAGEDLAGGVIPTSIPEIAAAAMAAAPARRSFGGLAEVGEDTWMIAGGGGAGEPIVRGIRQIGPDRWELVIELSRRVAQGAMDDGVSDYVQELAYAGEGA